MQRQDNLLMENLPVPQIRRVVAYIRVSTKNNEQSESLKAQRLHFWNVIHRNPNWELIGIYADEGRSATNIKNRSSLQRLLADARSGKIDLILTKSISRLSRNTVDVLAITRNLRLISVELFFEKELISSLDPKCEMMLSVLASIAQEESRNISENIKWGVLRKMENGDFTLPYGRFMGYKRGADGRPKIISKEARIIRQIYWLYINGVSINRITSILTKKHIPAPGGGAKWHWSTVYSILTNEKYMGSALLQKTYTPNFLTHKSVDNNRIIRQYYVENSHESIIDSETWQRVQDKLSDEKLKNAKLITKI